MTSIPSDPDPAARGDAEARRKPEVDHNAEGDRRIRVCGPRDIPRLHELIAALAEYEYMSEDMTATPADLEAGLFGPDAVAQAIIAEALPAPVRASARGHPHEHHRESLHQHEQQPSLEPEPETLGYALFFPTFSTFLGRSGIWLEDIFVLPAHRRRGIGRALLRAVALRALESGRERLEWEALDWNAPALGFYEQLGAVTRPGWVTHRLTGAALAALAGSRR